MKTLNARSKYVKAPDNFRSYTSGLGLHDSTGTIAILTWRDPRPQEGIRSGRRLCPRYVLEHWEVVLTRNSICHTQAPAGGSQRITSHTVHALVPRTMAPFLC